MSLDELIEALQALRRDCPAAGTAIVHHEIDYATIRYDRGCVFLVEEDDDGDLG